jgi:CubicO group peptidase (beta-lactamase class C family)
MRASLSVLVALLLVAAPSGQQPLRTVPPAAVDLAPEVLAEATALLEQFVADGKIAGGVAAIARRGQIGYMKAVGVQDLGTKAPMTERSLFRIYSMTKAVTAVAAMMLHDEGRFRLDDPVSKYLPEFADVRVVESPGATPRAPARQVTVEDLLLHTSGLSHRTSELYRTLGVRSRADTLPAFIRKITAAPLMEDPHTRFRYSEATTVLGRLVEIWSGEAFDRFLTRRIFQPLAMSDAPPASPRSTARRPAAASCRWTSNRCPSPRSRRCSKGQWASCRACPTSCASRRCCSTRARSTARACSRPGPRPASPPTACPPTC